MQTFLIATLLSAAACAALAVDNTVLDASHSQIVFSYHHFGFSTT